MTRLIFVFASLALVASEAQAQNTRLIGKVGTNRSASAVARLLEEAGCQRLWVSQALEDSKTVFARGRVILKTDSCEKAPPPEVARRSHFLLNPPVARKVVAPRVPALAESLEPKVAELEQEVANLKTQNSVLETNNKTLESKNSDANLILTALGNEVKTLKEAATLNDAERWRLQRNFFLYGVLGTLAALGLLWLLKSRKGSSVREQKIDMRDTTRRSMGTS